MAESTSSRQSDQETTIRIVFDGAPFAGKTTAAYSLGRALGGTTSTPVEEEGRTVWFDWMTYTGGRHNGKAIRVELVTVPGQDDLIERRRHLLRWGDVIVFVADTSAEAFDCTVAKYEELRADRAAIGGEVATIIIANKRDLDDALPMDVVRERLGLIASDEVVEAVAADGSGLRQAFIFAVRAALAGSPDRADSTTAELLLAEMRGALSQDVAPRQEAVDPVDTPGRILVNTRLCDGWSEPGAPVVLLAAHWRTIVAVTAGQTTLQLSNGTRESRAAVDLLDWGLVSGEITSPPFDEEPGLGEPTVPVSDMSPDVPVLVQATAQVAVAATQPPSEVFSIQEPPTPEEAAQTLEEAPQTPELRRNRRNDRYRALRELRRSLRGY